MKKFATIALAVVLSMGILTGCGSSKKAAEATTEVKEETVDYGQGLNEDGTLEGVKATDYVTVCDYSALKIPKKEVKVSDSDVQTEIDTILSSYNQVTDRKVKKGDTVNIDYKGMVDGKEFDGGTASGASLKIGSGTFIDGFEDGIIGMKKGQTKDLDLTFPEEYSSEELAGQEVVFKVTLQSFKRAPELTDDWAAKNTDCKTAEDYKKEIRKTLEEEAKTSAQNTLRETAWNTVLSASEVKEYPQDDLDTAKTEFKTLYENYAKQGDMTLEDFVKAQGISMDDFEEQSSQYAEYKVKQNLIVQGIMDAENMTLEDEKSLGIQNELIKSYNVKDIAALVDKYGQAAVDESIGLLRVEDFIIDNATVEEKVTAGDTQGVDGDDPSVDGSSAEGTVDEELETAEATDMVPEEEPTEEADSASDASAE